MVRRSKSSGRWLKEHFDDPYVKRAQREGWRSRAALKLEEIDRAERLIRPGMRIVDLGAAPHQVVNVPPGPAPRVQDPHGGQDPAPEQLVEQVDVDLPEVGPQCLRTAGGDPGAHGIGRTKGRMRSWSAVQVEHRK